MTTKLWRRATALVAAALFVPLLVPAADDEKPLGKLPPDLALVPRDALLFATVRPADVFADGRVKKLLPLVSGSGGGDLPRLYEWLFGLKPSDVERFTLVMRRMERGLVWVLRAARPIDQEAYRKRFARTDETTAHGKKIVIGRGRFGPAAAVWFADERTVVHGPDLESLSGYLGALSLSGKTHALADELKVAAGKHTLVAAARPERLFRTMDAERRLREERWRGKDMGFPKGFPAKDRPFPMKDSGGKERPFFKDGIKDAPPPPPPVKDKFGGRTRGLTFAALDEDTPAGPKEPPLKLRTMEEIAAEGEMRTEMGMMTAVFRPVLRAKTALLTADLGETITADVRAEFTSVDDAKDAEVLARMGLYLARELVPLAVQRDIGLDPKSRAAIDLLKQYRDAVRSVEVKADSKTLTAAAKVTFDLSPVLKAIADEVPARTDANNLKQLAIAFHAYHDSHGHMIRAICDARGRPLLSWRVAMLPYVEQESLYRQFKLDEPWDSPHNKKLISKMPKIYHPVVSADADPKTTTTRYQVFTGPGTMFPRPDSKTRLVAIPDGTSNTFLIAEAGRAVTWTKPDDIDLGAKAFPKLGGQFARFLHVAFADGSVRRVKVGADERTLRLFIDPADGSVVDFNPLRP